MTNTGLQAEADAVDEEIDLFIAALVLMFLAGLILPFVL